MKSRRKILLIAVILFSNSVYSQKQLLFENTNMSKTVVVEARDYLNLQFNGYLNQTTELKSYIAEITDSSLVFKSNDGTYFTNKTYEVKNSDITGFRKLSLFQPYVKPLINVSVTLGSYLAFDASKKFSDTEVLLYTTVIGIATAYVVNLIFKDDIEFKIADGWKLRVNAFAVP
ncbi:MAG: hypothetical protein L3J41_09675 [Melioribacteraceae bacterium]|nr:hypothetical protein [Melioribacteraceae bacterium]